MSLGPLNSAHGTFWYGTIALPTSMAFGVYHDYWTLEAGGIFGKGHVHQIMAQSVIDEVRGHFAFVSYAFFQL